MRTAGGVPPAPSPSLRRPTRRAVLAGAASGALALVAGGGWLLWDNRRIVSTRYAVHSERVPASFDGYRIVQVSDLHSARFGEGNRRLLTAVREERPDLVALTGDLVDRTDTDPGIALETASALTELAPVAYVTGNHEAESALLGELMEGLEESGVMILRDASRALARGAERIRLLGLEDPFFPRPEEAVGRGLDEGARTRQRLAGILAMTPEGADAWGKDPFTVLLAHRPEQLPIYAETRIDLALVGHAHGGQVRLPGVGGLFAPEQGLLPALTAGVVHRGRTDLVISRGLGNSVAPVRVNDPPEIVTISLHRG
ncbi:phosphoesterase [Brachybacterium endophyticum]|uniref:Phosphoesterase n=1 Tax=Brachybacterium endophyticum TaxID=2182385 RepID=A0A2U2RJ22_9MICO|nr:metallophosphoesterase [Brachybacterium endophyticum]PWH05841.1 phosphoesterase [Brachybacterium endophyticum]